MALHAKAPRGQMLQEAKLAHHPSRQGEWREASPLTGRARPTPKSKSL